MINVFNNPQKYIEEINDSIKMEKISVYPGKSMAVVFLTKFCPVECPFCFFHSKQKKDEAITEQNEFSTDGIVKLSDFLNSVNVETLEISGGGEPFENFEQLVQLIKMVKSDKIIIVTSGYWATNEGQTSKVLNIINEIVQTKNDEVDVTLRLSADKFHAIKVPGDNVKNIVNCFDENRGVWNNFRLKIHTIENDNTFFNLISNDVVLMAQSNNKYKASTTSGYVFDVEVAKMFYPNLKVNLNNYDSSQRAKNVFLKDIESSPLNNLSIYRDREGKYGLDFLIDYSGNITTWGNYQIENIPNIYIDDKSEIMKKIYRDPISYSFLTLSYNQRDALVREINEKAADRAMCINIRDYSGAYLLQEKDTQLFYQLAVVKHFVEEGLISKMALNSLSSDLKDVFSLNKDELKRLYNESNFDIIKQISKEQMNNEILYDLCDLVNCGHYTIKDIETYKQIVQFLKDKEINKENQQERLTSYLSNKQNYNEPTKNEKEGLDKKE